jgi:hypothetical protein
LHIDFAAGLLARPLRDPYGKLRTQRSDDLSLINAVRRLQKCGREFERQGGPE